MKTKILAIIASIVTYAVQIQWTMNRNNIIYTATDNSETDTADLVAKLIVNG